MQSLISSLFCLRDWSFELAWDTRGPLLGYIQLKYPDLIALQEIESMS
jgi:hypothetical protein